MGFRRNRRSAAQAEEDARLAEVTLSTLSTSQRAFAEVGLVWGGPAPDEAQALRHLRRAAREQGCDGVLGVALYSGGSERLFSGRRRHDQWRAYGTGVTWSP